MATEDWSKYAIKTSQPIQDPPTREDWSKYAVKNEPEFSWPRFLGEKAAKGALAIADLPQLIGSSMPQMVNAEEDLIRDNNGRLIGLKPPQIRTKEINPEEMASERIQRYLKGKGVDLNSQEPTTRLQRISGEAADFVGSSSIPGLGFAGKAGSAAQKAKQAGKLLGYGAGAGATSGALQEMGIYKPIADLVGIGAPMGLAKTNKFGKYALSKGKKIWGDKDLVSQDVFQGLPKSEINKTLRNQQAGERLGLNLTPAEASGNPLLAKTEGNLGRTPEAEQNLYEFKKGQKKAQKSAVEEFLNDVHSDSKYSSTEMRDVFKKIIDKRKKKLQDKASPVYQKSYHDEVSKEKLNVILNDSNIKKAYEDVLSDPIYMSELEGFNKNSVKVLDLIKKNLDGKINNLYGSGYNEEARIVSNARKKLIEALDEVSPNYKKARAIYSEDLPAIKALEDSKIGRIANLSDEKSSSISKIIFDPNETDFSSFKKIRDEIIKEDPEAWSNIVRHEMERRLSGSKSLSATENYGSEFYNNILAREKDFRKFYVALGKPNSTHQTPEQRKLVDMRRAFRSLINSRTAKTAAGQAETKMSAPRSTAGALVEIYNKAVKGKYDKAAIEIITDNNWKSRLPDYLQKQIKGDFPKNPNHFVESLMAIQASKNKKPKDTNDITESDEEV